MGRIKILELEKGRKEELYARLCASIYSQEKGKSGQSNNQRIFALVDSGRICAVVVVQRPTKFYSLIHTLGADPLKSWVICRMAYCCPGGYLVTLLKGVANILSGEGSSLLLTVTSDPENMDACREAGFLQHMKQYHGSAIFYLLLETLKTRDEKQTPMGDTDTNRMER